MAAVRVYDSKWNNNIFVWKAENAEGIGKDKIG
jgi:hypothetical protein